MSEETTVDSREGVAALFEYARSNGLALDQAHADLAAKWGVSTEGVVIRRKMPTADLAAIANQIHALTGAKSVTVTEMDLSQDGELTPVEGE